MGQFGCTLKIRLIDPSHEKFRISVKEEFPTINEKANDILLQFSMSHMCEQTFSYLTSVKSKDRNFSSQLRMNFLGFI